MAGAERAGVYCAASHSWDQLLRQGQVTELLSLYITDRTPATQTGAGHVEALILLVICDGSESFNLNIS